MPAALIMAMIPARIAACRFGQALMTKEMSDGICAAFCAASSPSLWFSRRF